MKELSDCTVLVVDDTEANVDILVDALGERYDVSRWPWTAGKPLRPWRKNRRI